jgi:hypothetical protein
MAPPGGMGAPMAGSVPPELQKKVDTWSMIAIATFFFGCGILALVPILMSNGAKDALKRGDIATAESKIGTVKILCILGFVNIALWVVLTIVYVIFMVVMSM